MNKLNWLDMFIFRIWYWRWNKILANRPDLREWLISSLKAFDVLDNGEKVKVTVKIEKIDEH